MNDNYEIDYTINFEEELKLLNRLEKYIKYFPKNVWFTSQDLKVNNNKIFDIFPDPENLITTSPYSESSGIDIAKCHKVDIVLYVLAKDPLWILEKSISEIDYHPVFVMSWLPNISNDTLLNWANQKPIYRAKYKLRTKNNFICYESGTHDNSMDWILEGI